MEDKCLEFLLYFTAIAGMPICKLVSDMGKTFGVNYSDGNRRKNPIRLDSIEKRIGKYTYYKQLTAVQEVLGHINCVTGLRLG